MILFLRSCVNDCNELHPVLDQTNRTATEAEKDLLMEHFADSIRELWGLGSCDNDVIVFYCQELNKVFLVSHQQSFFVKVAKVKTNKAIQINIDTKIIIFPW